MKRIVLVALALGLWIPPAWSVGDEISPLVLKKMAEELERFEPSSPREGKGAFPNRKENLDVTLKNRLDLRIMPDLKGDNLRDDNVQYEVRWEPEVDVRGENWRIEFAPKIRAFYYSGIDDSGELEFFPRDAYLEYSLDRLDISFGWRRYTWGKMDKIALLDVVNPYDMRQFFIDDKEERKFSTLSAYAGLFLEPISLEAVFVPVFEPSPYLFFNSDWAVFGRTKEVFSAYPEVQEIQVEKDERYDDLNSKNSEVYLRLRSRLGDVDLGLYYYYAYNHIPGLEGNRVVKQFLYQPTPEHLTQMITSTSSSDRRLEEYYRRSHTVGLDFETTLGEFGVRGELLWEKDMPFLASDFALVKRDLLTTALGVDYTSPDDWYVNFQWVAQGVLDYPGLFGLEKWTNFLMFNFRKDFLDGDLVFDVDSVLRLPYRDWFLNPELRYRWNESVLFYCGLYAFNGPMDSMFGPYKDNDVAYAGVELNF